MKIGKADAGIALYILAAFIMFIVSIPSWLLDILLAFNIGVAFLILFTVMFSKEVPSSTPLSFCQIMGFFLFRYQILLLGRTQRRMEMPFILSLLVS